MRAMRDETANLGLYEDIIRAAVAELDVRVEIAASAPGVTRVMETVTTYKGNVLFHLDRTFGHETPEAPGRVEVALAAFSPADFAGASARDLVKTIKRRVGKARERFREVGLFTTVEPDAEVALSLSE